ncbi:MAG: hypothetical protein COV52_05285 [Gammaproteobacteria bacterium CG11_big_fil_rev_8_21_14_0_20_46_22]|nr:MAG: hypothetical protein COW05_09970 [Gammaproteobacteria bacterium CG12_big_fil_rev_8_21_14_0_65_46_12]PIR11210.1 MAG: hypothetical protein COV52_05285 [Gammaproteobacteria bacterium CG11_big_fil_rev_8_21_14_0_20_46_22]
MAKNKSTFCMNPELSHRRVVAFASLLIVSSLIAIDLFSPALPTIQASLSLSQEYTRNLISVFFIGIGFFSPIFGFLSDRFGRKPTIICALGLSLLANLLCASAQNGGELLFYRLLSGIAAGGLVANARAVILDSVHERHLIIQSFATYAIVAQLSPCIAPSVGGMITHLFNWRMVFIFIALLSIFSLLIIIFKFQETQNTTEKPTLQASLHQLKQMLLNHKPMIYSVLSGILTAYIMSFFNSAPFLLENHFCLSPTLSGTLLLLFPAAFVLGCHITRKLNQKERKNIRYIVSYTLNYLALSLIYLLISHYSDSLTVLIIFAILFGINTGLLAPLLTGESMSGLQGGHGLAGATQSMIKMLSTGVFAWITTFVFINSNQAMAKSDTILSAILLFILGALIILERRQSALNKIKRTPKYRK